MKVFERGPQAIFFTNYRQYSPWNFIYLARRKNPWTKVELWRLSFPFCDSPRPLMILHLQVFGNGRSRWWSWWLSWWFAASCWCWSRRKATERESRSSGLFDGLDLDIKETLKTVKSTVIKKHKLFSSTFPTAHLLSCLPHRWHG